MWLVVLLTLAAVLVAVLLFVGGMVTGAALAGGLGQAEAIPPGDPGAVSSPGDVGPERSPGQPVPAPTGAVGPIDACLVGAWRTTSHEEEYDTEQGPASLTGLRREVTITADGRQTITYDEAEATVTTEVGALPAVFEGVVEYQVTTSGETMSFELLSSDGTVTVRAPGGQEQVEDLQAGAGAVGYSCDESSFSQSAAGFEATYERVS